MTNAELAILSLIVETPRHGYQIERVIEERGMRDWTEIGFSSIYYVLKKLERNGWVESRIKQDEGRGPARKVYYVTQDGMDAWHDATLKVLSQPMQRYSSLLLGLSNLPGLAHEEAIMALRHYAEHLAEQFERVRGRSQELAPLPYFVTAMFDHSVAVIEAELAWARRFIHQLEVRSREAAPQAEESNLDQTP